MAVGEVSQLNLPDFLSGLLVEGDAAAVHRADEDFPLAHGDAAAIGCKKDFFDKWVQFGLESPNFLAGFSVNRGNAIVCRDGVDHAVDRDRRLLDAVGDVTALVDPSDFELSDIGLVDLVERTITPRVARAMVLGPVVGILAAGGRSLRCSRRGADQKSQADKGNATRGRGHCRQFAG